MSVNNNQQRSIKTCLICFVLNEPGIKYLKKVMNLKNKCRKDTSMKGVFSSRFHWQGLLSLLSHNLVIDSSIPLKHSLSITVQTYILRKRLLILPLDFRQYRKQETLVVMVVFLSFKHISISSAFLEWRDSLC